MPVIFVYNLSCKTEPDKTYNLIYCAYLFSVQVGKKDKKMYKIRSLPSKKLVHMHIHVLFHLVNIH